MKNFSYKELYNLKYRKEKTTDPMLDMSDKIVKLSIGMTIVISFLFYLMDIPVRTDVLGNEIKEIVLYLAASLIGVMGFILSGIAIIASTLNVSALKQIEADGKYNEVVKILMSFWFIGRRIAGLIFYLIIIYLMILIPKEIIPIIFYIILVTTIYYVSYVIIYLTSLFETCIKIMNINYKYFKKSESNCNQQSCNEDSGIVDHIIVNQLITSSVLNGICMNNEEDYFMITDELELLVLKKSEEEQKKIFKILENRGIIFRNDIKN